MLTDRWGRDAPQGIETEVRPHKGIRMGVIRGWDYSKQGDWTVECQNSRAENPRNPTFPTIGTQKWDVVRASHYCALPNTVRAYACRAPLPGSMEGFSCERLKRPDARSAAVSALRVMASGTSSRTAWPVAAQARSRSIVVVPSAMSSWTGTAR